MRDSQGVLMQPTFTYPCLGSMRDCPMRGEGSVPALMEAHSFLQILSVTLSCSELFPRPVL